MVFCILTTLNRIIQHSFLKAKWKLVHGNFIVVFIEPRKIWMQQVPALARGKKQYDKRDKLRKEQRKKDVERSMKKYRH